MDKQKKYRKEVFETVKAGDTLTLSNAHLYMISSIKDYDPELLNFREMDYYNLSLNDKCTGYLSYDEERELLIVFSHKNTSPRVYVTEII